MYCKSCLKFAKFSQNLVLIVAKCIVNSFRNSIDNLKTSVLIVEKSIVNVAEEKDVKEALDVLIVAKCIVNVQVLTSLYSSGIGINSSKVYCK